MKTDSRPFRRFFAGVILGGALWAGEARVEGFTLDANAGVLPRIFSPNGDGLNDKVFFAVNNPTLSEITGKIYDVHGGEVADLAPVPGVIPTPDSLMWDGRDKGGNIVPAGPYIYEIRSDDQVINGSVVVAR